MKRASNKKFTSNMENRMNLKKMFSLTLALVIALTTTACGGGGGGGNNNGTSDTSKPTVAITAPANGATVGGAAVVLSATASDTGSGVNHVDFKVDGNTVCSTTGNTYSCTWNSTGVTNDSSHTFTAVAYDVAGNVSDPSSSTATVHNTVLTGTWRSVASPTTKNLKAVWASAPDNVYAVGEAGTIVHCTGSNPCSLVTPITSNNLNGIWGSSSNDIWVAGDNGTILHFNGSSWSTVTSPTSRYLTSVWGLDANNVVMTAAGGAGANTMIFWDGANWAAFPFMNDSLLSVWGTSNSNIWAVGYAGIIDHWNGTNWTRWSFVSSEMLLTVWGASADDAWIGGDRGNLFHWTGSGWNTIPTWSSLYMITSAHGTSANDVWFVGGPAIQHWDGASLTVVRNVASDVMIGVYAINANAACAVGEGGKILFYSP
jgi:hypothetical protein